MGTIFISYSRRDRAFVERLSGGLTSRSRETWVDWDDIPPSAEWLKEIERGIESADAFLFVISPDSIASRVCQGELAHAAASRKRLLPLVRVDVAPELVPAELGKLNWIFMREQDDFERGLSALLQAVDTDLEWVTTHTRLLLRAVEWSRNGHGEGYLLRGADLASADTKAAESAAKQPSLSALQLDFLAASREHQASELLRYERLYKNALARQLAAQSALILREDEALLDRALLLAVESALRVPSAEADRVLREGLKLRARELQTWRGGGECACLAVAPDRLSYASCHTDGTLRLYARGPDAEPVSLLLPAPATALSFDRGGARLAAVCGDETLVLRATDGLILQRLTPPGVARAALFLRDDALATAGDAGLTLWDAASGEIIWGRALPAPAWSLAVAADGSRLAAAGSDCVVRVFDELGVPLMEFSHETSRRVATLERGASDAGICGLAFAPDASRLVSGGLDGTVRAWELATGAELWRFEHEREVLALALSSDGRFVVSGSMDRTALVADLQERTLLARLRHRGAVTSVCFREGDDSLVTGSGDQTARLWDRASGEELARVVLTGWVNSVAAVEAGLLAATDSGDVVCWDRPLPEPIELRLPLPVRRCTLSTDDRFALVQVDHPHLLLFDVHDDFNLRVLPSEHFSDRVHFTHDGRLLLPDWGGNVRELDPATRKEVANYPHAGRVWASVLSADHAQLASAVHGERVVRVFRRGVAVPVATLETGAQTRGLSFSPDGESLLTASDDGSVHLFDIARGVARWRRRVTGVARDCEIDPGGACCVCGDDAGVVLVLDSKTGEELRRLEHPVSIAGLSFRRQGRLLAVRTSDIQGGNELHVFVWDASTGELLARLRHEDRVHYVEWSPDGTLLATASQDKRTRVFGAPEFHELTRHAFAEICAHVTFTGDGSRLFSCSYDGSLRVSRARAADLIALAQARLPRRLTPDEWHQYLGEEPLPST